MYTEKQQYSSSLTSHMMNFSPQNLTGGNKDSAWKLTGMGI